MDLELSFFEQKNKFFKQFQRHCKYGLEWKKGRTHLLVSDG